MNVLKDLKNALKISDEHKNTFWIIFVIIQWLLF